MTEDRIEKLSGEIFAIRQVLKLVIGVLDEEQATQVATQLKLAIDNFYLDAPASSSPINLESRHKELSAFQQAAEHRALYR